eukprot:scaffold25153_cov68-Phaeocystis_antarctica.AAC.6
MVRVRASDQLTAGRDWHSDRVELSTFGIGRLGEARPLRDRLVHVEVKGMFRQTVGDAACDRIQPPLLAGQL